MRDRITQSAPDAQPDTHPTTPARRPYVSPSLTFLGSVAELTLGTSGPSPDGAFGKSAPKSSG